MKLIIFDIDGVLNKQELLVKTRKEAQLKAVADKLNINMDEADKKYEEAKEKLSPDKRHTSVNIITNLGFTREEYFKIIDSVDPTGLIKITDNCKEMLEEIKNNVIIAYSNTPRTALVKTLKVLGIDKYFKKVYSVEDFDESKPSVNNLKKILKKEDFKAKDAVFIGNSLEKDIIPPHKLGIKTILFDSIGRYKNAKEADFIIKDLIEIVDIV